MSQQIEWHELISNDPKGSAEFYKKLLGWSTTEVDYGTGDGSKYTMFQAAKGPHSGIFAKAPSGVENQWIPYFMGDVKALDVKIKKAGGTALMDIKDTDHGIYCLYRDDQHAVFGVYQSKKDSGAQVVDEKGIVCGAWLPESYATTKVEAGYKFYGAIFDKWEEDKHEIDMGPLGKCYISDVRANGRKKAFATFHETPKKFAPCWLAKVTVEDIDKTVEQCVALGGQLVLPITDVPGGRFARVADPQGANFCVFGPGSSKAPGRVPTMSQKIEWHELVTSDPKGAVEFYKSLFGWKTIEMDAGEGNGTKYTMFAGSKGPHSGIFTKSLKGLENQWIPYMMGDVKALDAKIKTAGGTVVMEPKETDHGHQAIYRDNQNAIFALYQWKKDQGSHDADEKGVVCGAWLPESYATTKHDDAWKFYSAIFDAWEHTKKEVDMGPMGKCHTGDLTIKGSSKMFALIHPIPASMPPTWMGKVTVEDVDKTAAKCVELGGKLIFPVGDVPGGRFARLSDPQGASFGVFSATPTKEASCTNPGCKGCELCNASKSCSTAANGCKQGCASNSESKTGAAAGGCCGSGKTAAECCGAGATKKESDAGCCGGGAAAGECESGACDNTNGKQQKKNKKDSSADVGEAPSNGSSKKQRT